MDREAELNEALRALEGVFLAKLPDKLGDITVANQRLKDDPADRDNLTTLHRSLHNLAGSAGTFGFHEIGTHARALEQRIKACLHGENWESAQFSAFAQDVDAYVRLSGKFLPVESKDA
ncbi:MAG: Hpt domain-containing protein [Burkholderiales bacterium]|nr:Hpt domain-containing protein [Burkholderiales bacterium]